MKALNLLLVLLLIVSCQKTEEKPFSVADLHITWTVTENLGGTYANNWKITNQGAAIFPSSGWTIYYNHVVGVPVPESISGSLLVTQISGTFYSITPTDAFTAIGPGESTTIDLICTGSGIKITDAPSGLYLIMEESEARLIENYELGPFPNTDLMRRSAEDNVPIPTSARRFRENESLSILPDLELPGIIPTPTQVTKDQGLFELPEQIKIGYHSALVAEARLLQEKLMFLHPNVSLVNNLQEANVQLDFLVGLDESEYYELVVTPEIIKIRGTESAGAYYGTQSLIALWPLEQTEQNSIPCQTIKDNPRFHYRGLHLDVARNFHKPEAVKKTLDIMSFYKLNKLHLHLTDDEGWRLEINQLPELTAFGSVREHSIDEKNHLYPAYGSGPFAHADNNYGTGYYSRDEFIDILKYATARHIEVIPEINFPGHARAAIKAMNARNTRIVQSDSNEPSYLLHDPDDQSEYVSVQGYNDNVICPCQESIYEFLEVVIAEVVSIYQDAGASLTTIHTGGDEVPTGIWENSPVCAQFLAQNPEIQSVQDLSKYFFTRYHEILEQQDITTAGWEEVAINKVGTESHGEHLEPNPNMATKNVVPYVWNSNWGTHDDLAYKLANSGYKIVMCNANNLYFDFAYNKDPMEPGFYWSGLVDTRKPFELVPFDITKTATNDIMGNPLDLEQYQDHVKLTAEGRKNVLGIQGQLWSETVKGPELLEYYLFPKMIGLAERAWSKDPEWAGYPKRSARLAGLQQSWNSFANKLAQTELNRLDILWDGVNYRVPLPGAILQDGRLKANVAFPGLEIRYTLDGSEPDKNATLYREPIPAKKPVRLRAFTKSGKSSRTSVLGF